MRQKIARWLRKWADLVDPRMDPSGAVIVRIEVDSELAERRINGMIRRLRRVNSLSQQFRRSI